MALKPVKVKDAAQSNPMTMCEYLGHFKQARYLKMGHNYDGPGFIGPTGQSNQYDASNTRIDAQPDPNVSTDMVSQLLQQQPSNQIAPDPITPPPVRDPGPGNGPTGHLGPKPIVYYDSYGGAAPQMQTQAINKIPGIVKTI